MFYQIHKSHIAKFSLLLFLFLFVFDMEFMLCLIHSCLLASSFFFFFDNIQWKYFEQCAFVCVCVCLMFVFLNSLHDSLGNSARSLLVRLCLLKCEWHSLFVCVYVYIYVWYLIDDSIWLHKNRVHTHTHNRENSLTLFNSACTIAAWWWYNLVHGIGIAATLFTHSHTFEHTHTHSTQFAGLTFEQLVRANGESLMSDHEFSMKL